MGENYAHGTGSRVQLTYLRFICLLDMNTHTHIANIYTHIFESGFTMYIHWPGTHYFAQSGLELVIILPQPPKCYDCTYVLTICIRHLLCTGLRPGTLHI